MTKAIYLDGVPQNLEAASADALEWLRWWIDYRANHPERDRAELWDGVMARMIRCADCLEAQLAGVEFEFGETERVEK